MMSVKQPFRQRETPFYKEIDPLEGVVLVFVGGFLQGALGHHPRHFFWAPIINNRDYRIQY